MSRGRLRVYLGAATGVGTTCAMLDEAVRRRDRGTEVLVGCIDAHSRPVTLDRVRQLIDPITAPTTLDVDRIIDAAPGVVLVDELATRNPDGARREHRWQDVEDLLAAGIDVITTVTVQHIESLVDPVRDIVGYSPTELIPDQFLGRADQDLGVLDRLGATASAVTLAHGDGCEIDTLAAIGAADADVVAAATGDDEDNLVISLLAKQEFGVPRVVARVNNPNNEWMFDETWGVDVAVSTPHLLTGLVEEAVSVGSLVRLLTLDHGRAKLVEVTLATDSPAVGATLVEVGLPPEAAVVAVLRKSQVVVPRRDVTLQAGDEVMVLYTGDSEDAVRTALVS